MHTLILTEPSEWAHWREPWNDLAASNPMLSYEWLNSWWKVYGPGMQLHLVLLIDQDTLVGFAPCYVHTTYLGRELRFLGTGAVCSDHLSVAAKDSISDKVYRTFAQYFVDLLHHQEPENWLRMRLDGMDERADWLKIAQQQLVFHTKSVGNTWPLQLPETWSQFVESCRGKSVMRKIKKTRDRLEKGELSFRLLRTPDQSQEGLSIFRRLHQARRTSVGDPGCFSDERFEPFIGQAMEQLMARGLAAYSVCDSANGPVSIQLLLFSSTASFMYQSGIDPEAGNLEPGHAACYLSIQHAIEQGHRCYDFLRGDEPYKAFWGAEARPMIEAITVAGSWTAQAICGVDRGLRKLKAWTKRKMSHATPTEVK